MTMTAGQKLLEQGRRQGIQDLLLRLLRQRFGEAVDARVEQRVATVAVEQLEVWCIGRYPDVTPTCPDRAYHVRLATRRSWPPFGCGLM